uniref:Uncharacterized protein n=1 Tax=Arundo donax TaxID=35708 RepID=A0A0A9E0X3_ARUDO
MVCQEKTIIKYLLFDKWMIPLIWRAAIHPSQNKNHVNQMGPQIIYKNQMLVLHRLLEQSLWRKQAAHLMRAKEPYWPVLQQGKTCQQRTLTVAVMMMMRLILRSLKTTRVISILK